jgi:histidinol-phosphatase (PHP family)
MIDYHMHTSLCKHASGEVYEFVERAITLGISKIAFTDHIPLPGNFDIAHRMKLSEMGLYQRWIRDVQCRYPEITIMFGIEADYYEGFEEYLSQFLSVFDLDIVIMSVHFVRHWPKGNWVFDYDFPDKKIEEIYTDYIDIIKKGVNTGLFDVIGHIDIIKRPGESLLKNIPQKITDLLNVVKNKDMAIEINTSGYRKSVAESYPGLDWLPVLSRFSIPICTGSDAHTPQQVGLNFKEVYKAFEKSDPLVFAQFQKRHMTIHNLEQINKA